MAVKKKDTRSYFNSMYNVAVKAAVALGGVVSNTVLMMINYKADMVLDAAGKSKMTMLVGLGTAIWFIFPIVCMAIHPMSDKQADEYAKQNMEEERAELEAGAAKQFEIMC